MSSMRLIRELRGGGKGYSPQNLESRTIYWEWVELRRPRSWRSNLFRNKFDVATTAP